MVVRSGVQTRQELRKKNFSYPHYSLGGGFRTPRKLRNAIVNLLSKVQTKQK